MPTKAIVFDLWDTVIFIGGMHPIISLNQRLKLEMDLYKLGSLVEKSIMMKKYPTLNSAFSDFIKNLHMRKTKGLLSKLTDVWKKSINSIYMPPAIEEMLIKCREKYKTALLTNTDCFAFEFAKKRYGIGKYFDFVVTSYSVGSVKPDRKIYNILLKKLKAKPQDVWMCGDSLPNDIIPAKKLGFKTILLDVKKLYGKPKEADLVAHSVQEFTGFVGKL